MWYGLKTQTSDEVRQGFFTFVIISQKLLAANLPTTANQLSATSVLIQENQHGDCKQSDIVSFAEAFCKAPTKAEWNVFCECRSCNSFTTVREHMYGSFDQTCDM